MFSRKQCQFISFGLASSMFVVAWGEFQHGKQPADIHLITSVQLVPGSTVVFTGAGYHENAIIEAVYREPPDASPLRLNGLAHPSP